VGGAGESGGNVIEEIKAGTIKKDWIDNWRQPEKEYFGEDPTIPNTLYSL
jgi:hypothetical protein